MCPTRIALLVAVRGLSSLSYYMFIPFLGVLLIDENMHSSWEIGIVVGATILTARASSVVMPRVIKKTGEKNVIIWAYIIATVLFLMIAIDKIHSFPLWIVISGTLGLAFASATLSMKSWIANAASKEALVGAYASLNIAVNVGSALGPAIAGWLVSGNSKGLLLCAAGGLLLSSILACFLPTTRRNTRADVSELSASTKSPLASFQISKPFLMFVLGGAFTWIAYSQVFDVLPTYAKGHMSERLIGLLFTINAILIILLQVPATRYLRYVKSRENIVPLREIFISQMVIGISMLGFGLLIKHILAGPIIAIILFTCSEVIWSPLFDVLTAELRGSMDSTNAFAYTGLIWGIAESLGSWAGLSLVAPSRESYFSPMYIGLIFAVCAGLMFIPVSRISIQIREKTTLLSNTARGSIE